MSIKHNLFKDEEKEVTQILRGFNQPEEWQDSPWLSSSLVKFYIKSGKSQTPHQAIRVIFSDILNLLSDESPYYGDILRGRYWEGQHVAQMVKNGRPQYWEERTFYLYQRKAIKRFTTLLVEREKICQKSMLHSKSKYIEIFNKYRIIIFNILFFSMIALLFIVFDKEKSLPSKAYSESTLTPSDNILFPASTNSKVVFHEDFEDETADGFKKETGLWLVVSENNGNKVLDIDSMDTVIEYPTITFGEVAWKDFVFEFRINIINYEDSPLITVQFRGNYMLTFAPYWNGIGLNFAPPWEDITNRVIEIQKNKWYSVRMEVQGSKINVFLENKLIIFHEISSEISGIFSFGVWPGIHAQFDDVIITLIE